MIIPRDSLDQGRHDTDTNQPRRVPALLPNSEVDADEHYFRIQKWTPWFKEQHTWQDMRGRYLNFARVLFPRAFIDRSHSTKRAKVKI